MPSKNSLEKYASDNGLFFNGYNSYAEDYSNTLLYGEISLMKNGNKLKNKDLIAHLRECGNFISLIVKQDLNLEILI